MRGDLVFLLLLGFLVFSVQERWVEEIPMVKHDHLLCEKSKYLFFFCFFFTILFFFERNVLCSTIEAVQLKGKKRGHSYSGPLQLQVRFKSTTKVSLFKKDFFSKRKRKKKIRIRIRYDP